MKRLSSLHSAILFLLLAVGTQASGQVLLLDPNGSDTDGISTTLIGSTPYVVPAGSSWNQGDETYSTPIVYSDGSAAAGVSVFTDGATLSGGTGTVDFVNSPDVVSLNGNVPASSIFGETPAQSASYIGGGGSSGFLGMRITSLPFGTYDIYVAAAYIGTNTEDRPGGNTPAAQNVWIFSGGTFDTLSYADGTVTGAGAAQLLPNDTNNSWIEDRNFERRQITLDSTNPTLYVATAGIAGHSSGESRPWLNLVQIVAVPEPSTALLMIGGALGLTLRRRRV